jgi:DNA-binding NarL/FixJ family response regulator
MEFVARLGSDAPLVGRARELARLTTALAEARQRQPSVVLLSGDAGVGKTRLLAEFARSARTDGAIVLLGHCVDLGSVGLPYLPFAEALQQLAESSGPDGQALHERPGLSQLLPNRGSFGAATQVLGKADIGQLQLFDAVATLLGEAGQSAPVVLILEDLHWADQSTRDLLTFLVARLRSERLALVASYRADDLHRRHPLRPLLAELVRQPTVERLDLQPFTEAEMRTYLRVLYGRPLSESAVRNILTRSEGNAYFAEELLAAGVTRGDTVGLPTGLAEVLLSRLEQLSPGVQQLARLASVAGRRVSHTLLQKASGLPEAELEAALREAVTHQILVPDGDEHYAFRHALLQEAVYGDLLPGERVRLHATYARLLTESADTPQPLGSAAELAYHCRRSQDLPGALAASVRAADEASELRAPVEALAQLEQALEVWAAVPNAEQLTGLNLTMLQLRAAAAAGRCGELHRAAALATAARDGVDPAVDPELAAYVRRKLAYHLLGADEPERALTEATAGLALIPPEPPSSVRVWLTATRARAAVNLDRDDEARQCAEDALAGARALDLADAEADALVTLAMLDESSGETESARIRLIEARECAAAAADLAVESRATYNLAGNRFYAGDLVDALSVLDEGVERARRTGLTWSAYGIELRVLQVIARYMGGDWDGSLHAAELAGDRPPDEVVARLAAARLYVEVGRGSSSTAERMREAKEAWHHDPQIALIAGGTEADLRLWQGNPEAAVTVAEEAIAWLKRAWGTWSLAGIWLAALAIAAHAEVADAARLRGDETAATLAATEGRELLQYAHTTAKRGRPRAGRLGPEGLAWLARADAEASRLDGRSDPKLWQAAITAYGYGYPYEQARCQWRLAEALLAAERRDEAAEQVRQAYQTAQRLGAQPLVETLEALGRRARLDAGLPARVYPNVAALTPRERDVLTLLAEGLTNRQIGTKLFISEKTASVHVSNILGKLGASGRTEAAAIAHRTGLLELPTSRSGGGVPSRAG